MKQKIVTFTGISCVARSTFLNGVVEELPLQHLAARSLITAAQAEPVERWDDLRCMDLEKNQRLLICGFVQAKDTEASVAIMDGHVINRWGEWYRGD